MRKSTDEKDNTTFVIQNQLPEKKIGIEKIFNWKM